MSRNNSRRRQVQQDTKPQSMPGLPPGTSPPDMGPTFVVPTEFVDLPTRGSFYADTSTMYGVERVEVKYMTAKEEDILVNQDYVSRGIVFDKLVESIMVDKSIKVEDISDIDKVAIMASARKTGYGESFVQNFTCEACKKDVDFEFNLETLIENALGESEENPEGASFDEEKGLFTYDLPVSKYKVVCKVLNNDDFKYLIDLEKQRNKHSIHFSYTVEFLRKIIVEVIDTKRSNNPITNPEVISQFLDYIPALDSKKLKTVHNSLTPSFRLHQEVECPSCKTTQEKEVPFSWAWFWGNS